MNVHAYMKRHYIYLNAHIIGGQTSVFEGFSELPDMGAHNQTQILWKSRKPWTWPKKKVAMSSLTSLLILPKWFLLSS